MNVISFQKIEYLEQYKIIRILFDEETTIKSKSCSLLVVFIHAGEIPVLIPNTEVKPSVVDDTWTV